jgi:N-acetylmuramoyl-L-alanine amidase
MTMRWRAWIVAVVLFALAGNAAPQVVGAAPRDMYAAAMSREQALRAAWTQPAESTDARAALRQARAIVSAYEEIVRRYPTSGYCDDALWHAATLSADVFGRSAQEQDRQAAARFFEFLCREYPSSPFLARAANQARRLASPAPANASDAAKGAESNRGREAPASRTPNRAARELPASSSIPPSAAAALPVTAPTTSLTTIRTIRRTVLAEVVRVSIELDREVVFHAERVENPARLLFDLPATEPVRPLRNATWAYQDDVVRHIRLGSQGNQTTRVVLDLDGVSRYTIVTLYNPYKILIDCERATPARPAAASAARPAAPWPANPGRTPTPATAAKTPSQPALVEPVAPKTQVRSDPERLDAGAGAPADAASNPAKGESRGLPEAGKRNAPPEDPDSKAAALNPAKAGSHVPEKKPVPEKPGPERGGAPGAGDRNRVSMARQLGLGIARVVIDPGHGGRDPGAEGSGMNEADIVLDIALRLEKLLAKQRGVEVVLTRRADVFVPLEERTEIANREQADLFLSIHANASRNTNARGVETYYLNFATNPDAEAVAARENAASERTMNSLPDIVKAIALNNKLDESKNLAALVQDGLARRLRASNKTLKNLGVKQAPFVVLIGAAMPSVLVEVSFLTHQREGQLLRTESYRQRIAESLADAIAKYRKGLKSANAPVQE